MTPETFWLKVEKTDTCWLWTGAKQAGGYGHALWYGRYRGAHRIAYALVVGEIPDGLVLDHLCRVPACVRPDHLEPVTNRENLLRGEHPNMVRARADVCSRGHSYAEFAFLEPRSNGGTIRRCRACVQDRERLRSRRRRAVARAA